MNFDLWKEGNNGGGQCNVNGVSFSRGTTISISPCTRCSCANGVSDRLVLELLLGSWPSFLRVRGGIPVVILWQDLGLYTGISDISFLGLRAVYCGECLLHPVDR